MAIADMKSKIRHVVVLMLENRGFDSVLGWLYEGDDAPSRIVTRPGDERPFLGLANLPDRERATANRATLAGREETFFVRRGAQRPSSPYYNPHEDYEHVTRQLFGRSLEDKEHTPTEADAGAPTMDGFAADFATNVPAHLPPSQRRRLVQELFDTFTPEQLPVLSGLARHYAVSDEWFSSVPSQTNANRAFFLAGTSLGLVKNDYLVEPPTKNWVDRGIPMADDRFRCRTIWHVLEGAPEPVTDWKHYHHLDDYPPLPFVGDGPYTWRLFPRLAELDGARDKFVHVNEFYRDAAEGRLPRLCVIEPDWSYSHNTDSMIRSEGNDYHPPADTTAGEDLLLRVYTALSRGPAWDKTLLVITFDEHGGTYDHVPPPWGACPPWGADGAYDASVSGKPREYGFLFDRFGVRVPALLISPHVDKGVVFRSEDPATPFDHTSILKTVCAWLDIPDANDDGWGLGARVKAAPSFAGVISGCGREDSEPFGVLPDAHDAAAPLWYGDMFRLRSLDTDQYLGPAYSGVAHWYPTVAGDPGDCFLTLVKLGPNNEDVEQVGQVMSGDRVLLCSLEARLGTTNAVSVTSLDRYCRYTRRHPPADNSAWKIQMAGYASRIGLCFGDRVHLFNRGRGRSQRSVLSEESYEHHRLVQRGDYVSAQKGEWGVWIVERVTRPQSDGADLEAKDAWYLVDARGGALSVPRTNALGREIATALGGEQLAKLTFVGRDGAPLTGPIGSGAIVRIKALTPPKSGPFLGVWTTGVQFAEHNPDDAGLDWEVALAAYPKPGEHLRDGDQVCLISQSPSFQDHHLVNKSGKLSSAKNAYQRWRIQRA